MVGSGPCCRRTGGFSSLEAGQQLHCSVVRPLVKGGESSEVGAGEKPCLEDATFSWMPRAVAHSGKRLQLEYRDLTRHRPWGAESLPLVCSGGDRGGRG